MPYRTIALWILATASATVVAWGAVAQVTKRTVEPLPAGITSEVPTSPASSTPPGSTPPPSPDPTGTTAGPATGVSPTAGRTEDPTIMRSFQLAGGDITISFSARSVDVVSVTPRQGYTLKDANRHSPTDVEVDLRAEDARSRLRAWWDGGPQHRLDEDD